MRRNLASLVGLLLITVAALFTAGPASAAACVNVPAVAHRGGTERYVENTGNAFRNAANVGAPSWETDVQFSADNTPWIMHDDTVGRTTNGTGAVADLTDAQMAALRTTADDQPVPTLRQLVNDAEVDGATIFPELKTMPTDAQWTSFLAALGSRPIASQIVVTSFDGPTLVALRAHTTLYATGLIQELGDQTVASVTQYAGTSILIKHHNAITWSRLSAWQAGGLQVYSWTVDTTAEWQRMNGYPTGWLDGVITDQPAAYLAWQRGRTC